MGAETVQTQAFLDTMSSLNNERGAQSDSRDGLSTPKRMRSSYQGGTTLNHLGKRTPALNGASPGCRIDASNHPRRVGTMCLAGTIYNAQPMPRKSPAKLTETLSQTVDQGWRKWTITTDPGPAAKLFETVR